MIYIENIYVCMLAPLLVASFCTDKEHRKSLIFLMCGMTTCLLSAYVNFFFAQMYQTTIGNATVEIAPLVEEGMKILPILFYLLVFEPKNKNILGGILMVAVGFATFENICYLVEHGAEDLQFLLMRGFGTGAMHIVCGAIVGYGLLFTWKYRWLHILGTFGVVCIAIIYHGEYNLLVSSGAIGQIIGVCMPIVTILVMLLVLRPKLNQNI